MDSQYHFYAQNSAVAAHHTSPGLLPLVSPVVVVDTSSASSSKEDECPEMNLPLSSCLSSTVQCSSRQLAWVIPVMSSITRPASGISHGCQYVVPIASLRGRNFVIAPEMRDRSGWKLLREDLPSASSNRDSMNFEWRFRREPDRKSGRLYMCAIPSTGDMPGEPSDNDASNETYSVVTENSPTMTVQVQQCEVDGFESTELLVEEYKLDESGQLSRVKVSVAGTSRVPTFVDDVLIRIKPYLQLFIQQLQSVQQFSVRQYVREYGKKKSPPVNMDINAAAFEPKKGVDNIIMWTSTELTLQHAEMMRIAKDTRYLVWAFGLFGVVRILEAMVLTFTTRPFHLRKLLAASNALDPLTIAWLAHGMRQPIVAMLKVDPSDLHEVNRLKIKFWKELHAFYERQWKVMATLGVVRLLNLIATHLPAAQFITGKLNFLWNVMLSLPLF